MSNQDLKKLQYDQSISIDELRESLIDEIVKSIGLPQTKFWRRIFSPIFWLPTHRFSQVGARFDAIVANRGFHDAMQDLQAFFVNDVDASGVENIPEAGPLLMLSNHPGTYDAVILSAQVRRNDVKIVASDIPFIEKMKTVKRHFLFATRDTYKRMVVIRQAIEHLHNDGVVIIFPSGHIDPEPAFLSEAMDELENWSKAIEIFVKKVPKTLIQVALVSNVLAEKYFRHPFTKLRKQLRDRQRIGEFLQVMRQLVLHKRFDHIPKVSFGKPFTIADIGADKDLTLLLPYVKNLAREMMSYHLQFSGN